MSLITLVSVMFLACIGLLHFAFISHCTSYVYSEQTSTSAMAERPRELGDFKGVSHFEAKF